MLFYTRQEAYYIYINQCNNGSFYTGLTDDLTKRFEEHTSGINEKCYAFNKRPVVAQ